MISDDVAGTIAWGAEAIALADELDDTETLARSLIYAGVMELTREDDAGREKLERAITVARRAGLAPEAGRGYINLVAAYARARVCGAAELELGRASWAAFRAEDPRYRNLCLAYLQQLRGMGRARVRAALRLLAARPFIAASAATSVCTAREPRPYTVSVG